MKINMYYEVDYSLANQVGRILENYMEVRNDNIDLQHEITRLTAKLKFSQGERRKLEQRLVKKSL